MLAKVWKKALLAICILACIYNVTHKLVSRTSLEIQLKSVENQAGLIDMFKEEKKQNEALNSGQTQETFNQNQVNETQENQDTARDEDTIVVIN